MENILGLDLGTNSIGVSVRNAELGNDLKEQLSFFQSDIFPSGVGKGKSGEFSFAAERTKKRSPRHLIWARKCRIWATLDLLIENGYCPLAKEDLDKWRKYDKEKGLFRQYPIEAEKFEQWVRLDFNGDGTPDYSSPYQLRAELMTRQFDFSKEIERFKLGRALYHIAQRRGFKSSKGETLANQKEIDDDKEIDMTSSMKKSEKEKSSKIEQFMSENNLPTVGCAFALLEKQGIRIRDNKDGDKPGFVAVRSQYRDEIKSIFEFQKGLDIESDFFNSLYSDKKSIGTIFYKRPLKSQKGLVGKCTLEPSKPRCAISHPDFEKYRAWTVINNIKVRKVGDKDFIDLDIKHKKSIFNDIFISRVKANFKMEDIRKYLEKLFSTPSLKIKLEINYKEDTSVSGCPVSANMKKFFGDDYENAIITRERINKNGEKYTVKYNYVDIWHICFSCDDVEYLEEFAHEMQFDQDKTKALMKIWSSISQGYSNLSLKALRNITQFLERGIIYSHSVFLAKLPEIFGQERWQTEGESIVEKLDSLIKDNVKQKEIYGIVNTLIADYKSLDYDEQFANHNNDYILQQSDIDDINRRIIDNYGEKTWEAKSKNEKTEIFDQVKKMYQEFFQKSTRDYYHLPKMADYLREYILENYQNIDSKKLSQIYHPSMMEFYPKVTKETNIGNGILKKLLPTPTIGAIKNPLVMRVLHILRNQVNQLIKNDIVNEHTRVVVELARDVNDANVRWAIEQYQKDRENENKKIIEIIKEIRGEGEVSDEDIEKVRLWSDQLDIVEDYTNLSKEKVDKLIRFKTDLNKYKAWKEQKCMCIYTGKMISLKDLFDENKIDFEHTIPRSISFDNSLSNRTVCFADFNRKIKKNLMPTQLSNYNEIEQRIQPWIKKVKNIKDQIRFWKNKSKKATTKDIKDDAIRQRHIWEFELDYWQKKVNSFTITEYKSGFRNSQLNDTRIISKYAFHYLKTVFDRVEVQKGEVTASFRKILGIQSLEQKKSRDKHSHHAIDATVLTMIPVASRRETMLKYFNEREEEEMLNGKSQKYWELDNKLKYEIRKCNFGSIDGVKEFIENNILINHISKDQTLTPASRNERKRGKKTGRKINGDCIRGQLHKETFFGAIKLPEFDENGKPIVVDGKYKYQVNDKGADIITMVVRVPINSFKSEKDFEKIIDPTIKETIKKAVKQRISEGMTLEQALAKPIYATNAQGEERKKDKNGRIISHIRHVRCKVAAGRGYMTKEKSLTIKKQTYKSDKEYKNFYYAQNDGNYLCLLYEGIFKGKVDRKFVFVNYFEVAGLKLKSVNDLYQEPYYNKKIDGKKEYNLSFIIKAGTRVLMWKDSPDEVLGASNDVLNKRLYVVYKFNETSSPNIYLQHHLEARANDDIKEDDKDFVPEKYQPRLTLVANKFNCLIENRDFVFTEKGIKFI